MTVRSDTLLRARAHAEGWDFAHDCGSEAVEEPHNIRCTQCGVVRRLECLHGGPLERFEVAELLEELRTR